MTGPRLFGALGPVSELMKIYKLPRHSVPTVETTESGAVATFQTDLTKPLVSLVADINLVQAGSGDPSPDNVRPISGWTGAEIYHSGEDTSRPTSYPVTWQTEAGTVYGGIVDVATGVLTVEYRTRTFDGSISTRWSKDTAYGSVTRFNYSTSALGGKPNGNIISNYLRKGAIGTANLECCALHGTTGQLMIQIATSRLATDDVSGLMRFFTSHNFTIVYELAEPLIYHIDPITIRTIVGQNNIWANCGDVSVTYLAKP